MLGNASKMDRSTDRINVELRDCQHTVPRMVHSRRLPSLDTKVLLIADIDDDGYEEVLMLQGGRQLVFTGLRESATTATSYESPFAANNNNNSSTAAADDDGALSQPLQLQPCLGRATRFVGATFGADGTQKQVPSHILAECLDVNEQTQTQPTQQLTYIQLSGVPGLGQQQDDNNSNSANSCTIVDALWIEDARFTHVDENSSSGSAPPPSSGMTRAASTLGGGSTRPKQQHHQRSNSGNYVPSPSASSPGPHGALVLILMEGYVVYVTAKQLKKILDKNKNSNSNNLGLNVPGLRRAPSEMGNPQQQTQQQHQHNTTTNDATSDHTAASEQTTANNSMVAGAIPNAKAAQQQQQQQQHQQRANQNNVNNTSSHNNRLQNLITIHFSQMDAVWEVPWSCCCAAIEQSTGTLYAGFACGLVLAIPIGQQQLQKEREIRDLQQQQTQSAKPPASAPVPIMNRVPTAPGGLAKGSAYGPSQSSLTSTPGPDAIHPSGITTTAAAAEEQQHHHQQKPLPATTTTAAGISGNTPTTSSHANLLPQQQQQQQQQQQNTATSAGTSGGNTALPPIIPASTLCSSLTVGDAPYRIAPLSYAADKRRAVIIATKNNVVLVDAACFVKASFTQSLANVQLLWGLQVTCVSLTVFQIGRESTCWSIVSDQGAVFLFTIDGEGRINRCEFRVTSTPLEFKQVNSVPATSAQEAKDAPSSSSAATPQPQQQQQQQFGPVPLGGDIPRHALITIDEDEEICVIIISENGGVTICDKMRRFVHCSGGGGSVAVSRMQPSSTSLLLLAGGGGQHRRVQTVLEVNRERRSNMMMIGGGGGGGVGTPWGSGTGGNFYSGAAPILGSPAFGHSNSSNAAAVGVATPMRRSGSAFDTGMAAYRAGSTITTGTAVPVGTSPNNNPTSPTSTERVIELLVVDNCYVRHIQVKLPSQVLAERRQAQRTWERLCEAQARLANQLGATATTASESAAGAPTAASNLLASCGFSSLVALGNSIITERETIESFRGHQMRRSGSVTLFDDE